MPTFLIVASALMVLLGGVIFASVEVLKWMIAATCFFGFAAFTLIIARGAPSRSVRQ